MKPVETKIKGILIDVVEAEVREVDVPRYDDNTLLYGIRKQLKCDHIEVVYSAFKEEFPEEASDVVFVDDAGLFNSGNRFFFFPGLPNPIAGNGIILGADFETGDTVSHTLSNKNIEFLKKNVLFFRTYAEASLFMRLLSKYNAMMKNAMP